MFDKNSYQTHTMDLNFLKDLSEDFKRILFNMLIVMPFWFMFIFFFNPYSINENIIVHIIFSFCLSFINCILFFIPTILLLSIIVKDKNSVPDYAIEVTTIITCIFVSVFIYIGLNSNCFCPIVSLKYIFIYSLYYFIFSIIAFFTLALFGRK